MIMHGLIFGFFFSILNAVTDIKETATAVNFTMLKLVALQANDINISGRIDMGKLIHNYSSSY